MTASSHPSPARIAIWGAGGHGHVVADLLSILPEWNPVGFVDNVHPKGATVMGLPVLGDRAVLPDLLADGVSALAVAIGDPLHHADMMQIARDLGFGLPSLLHPSCILSPSASVAEGCFLCAGSIVGPQSVLKPGVILNTKASLDHDVHVGRCVHVAPGATICGFNTIGDFTWIGTGAIVRDHLSIGPRVMIGAGATVLRDIPGDVTAYGVPAKVIKRNPAP